VQVQRLASRDLQGWLRLGDALPDLPPWAAPRSTWAPAVLPRAGGYVLYFASLVEGTDRHCIGAAVAPRPEGPYRPDPDPLVCPMELGGAIDPSPFVDRDGQAWLLWKNDGITLRRESGIWSQRLTADGRRLSGDASALIATDQDWEYPHVEAPSMTRIGDTYWLAYSGAWWNQAAYGVGLARCGSASGPCTKPFSHAVLSSRSGAEGPGGLEWFVDLDGRLSAAYHAWPSDPGYPGSRALWIAPVDTTGDAPVIRSG
jgi:beta-xylosidase